MNILKACIVGKLYLSRLRTSKTCKSALSVPLKFPQESCHLSLSLDSNNRIDAPPPLRPPAHLFLSRRSLRRSKNSTTIAEFPLKAAWCNAVFPSRSVALMTSLIASSNDARLPRSSAATKSKPQTAAHVRAVWPARDSMPELAPWFAHILYSAV